MGLDTRRPPLPAPTDMSSMDEKSAVGTEVATNVTDKTSYSIPEDGSPITISTQKVSGAKEGRHHSRQKSQTSLLIEYFEAGKKGDKARSKPSVRVKVTPSSRKSSRQHDAVQITSVGKDRKPSYTRRISLSGKGAEAGGLEPTEVSQSTGSSVSQRPPVEVEILNQDGSDLSQARSSRGLMYSQLDSNVSSMPPDSMVEGSMAASEFSRDTARDEDEELTVTEKDHLKAPIRARDRSVSQERLTQKVMEKLGQNPGKTRKSSRDYEHESGHRRRRSSKSHTLGDDAVSGAESSFLSSNPTASQRSWRSSTSQASSMTKNPKLLEMVEDTIKRMILPEISAIREDQRVDRNHRTFEEGRRGSAQYSDYDKSSLQRSVSKSSSTPHLTSRPKVVLNRDGDDPGTVLSRGDSEYKKHGRKSSRDRPSSRRSSGRHSIDESYTEETTRPESRKSSHRVRDAAAGAIAGGILTSAALKHHDSQGDVHERRKKRSKSRGSHSRSASNADTMEDYRREELIPPMPMASRINDSEMTRESILSDNTAMPESEVSHDVQTPIREVSRHSIEAAMSPTSSRTPTRTPVKGLGMSHSNQSIQSSGGISTKARIAALSAAGLGAAAAAKGFEEHREHDVDADGYGGTPPPRAAIGSPAQSVSSLRNKYEEPLIPSALRPRSAASRSSVNRLRESTQSPAGSLSVPGSPSTRPIGSRKQSQNISGDEFVTPLERPEPGLTRSGMTTPVGGESIDEWYERQHQQNERYRDSFDATTNRASYQTNPYPEDEKRFSTFTQDSQPYSQVHSSTEDQLSIAQDVRGLGANPDYVHHPGGVESNVASLVDPSSLSSGNFTSSMTESAKTNGTYSDRMAEHLRSMGKEESVPAPYEGSTLSEAMPSQSRWAALKSSAADHLSASPGGSREQVDMVPSPKQSETRSLRQERSLDESPVKMGASGLPVADDPLPEIGHFDDAKSEVSTNPSVIQGPLGGDATGKSTWPYTPSPPRSAHSQREEVQRGDGRSLKSRDSRDSRSVKSGHGKEAALLGAGVGAGAALAGMKAAHKSHQPRVDDEYDEQRSLTPDTRRYSDELRNNGKLTPGGDSFREDRYDDAGKLTPDGGRYQREFIDRNATPTSPAMLRDEGYDTAHDRSAGALTPKAEQHFGKADIDDFNRAMNGPAGGDDPFIGDVKHARHVSGGSHGMASPLYDSSTGKGMNNIASKDIVALMDHLTVRDAQRNARDTEILVTLVRSATEMRANFDEMKQFIMDQDRMIMQNTDRDADQTVQRVLGGPRPQPPSTPRTPRQTSQEDVQAKRKGVLRRALKGLTGGKSASDLTKIEDMLNQILDNVEDLKHQGVAPRQPMSSYLGNDSMDSYEKLRAAPDSGYEPEGAAGTDSTPSNSGNLSITPRGEKYQFHSGYNGRPGSVNRVSTVLEGDEDDESYLAPHERQILDNQFENNERMSTPTQEKYSQHSGRGLTPTHTPPRQFISNEGNDLTPKTAEKQRKHNSNSSSLFAAVPKISRWSKTTSSSVAPDPASVNSPNMARNERPRSQASVASSSMQSYDSYDSLQDNGRIGSKGSLSREQDIRSHGAETRSMRSQVSRLTRTPSPLIPSEASYRSEDYDDLPPQQQRSPVQQDESPEFEDPKYQAHRNSLLLEHPQPRQGPTSRHQNTLEHQAHNYGDDPAGNGSNLSQSTVSDFDPAMWGSSGAAALNRNRFSTAETSSPASLSSPRTTKTQQSQPQPQQPVQSPQQQQKTSRYDDYDDEDEDDWEPEYSNSGFAKNNSSRMYYSSPLGSGHLLEPIEEVRYSLETDSGRVTPPEPQVARAVDVRNQRRNITGPRPMAGAKSPGPGATSIGARLGEETVSSPPGGTIRRKPVRGSQGTTSPAQSM